MAPHGARENEDVASTYIGDRTAQLQRLLANKNFKPGFGCEKDQQKCIQLVKTLERGDVQIIAPIERDVDPALLPEYSRIRARCPKMEDFEHVTIDRVPATARDLCII